MTRSPPQGTMELETVAVYPDWSDGFPLDLMYIVIALLDIPDLLYAGAVCASWHAACAVVRHRHMPITVSSQCLLLLRHRQL